MLPVRASPRGDARRKGAAWTPEVQLGPWSVSQKQLLVLIALAVVSLMSLASVVREPHRLWLSASTRRWPVGRSTDMAAPRREAIKEAMQFVWRNYHERAFGADEIKPLNGAPNNPWGGVGCMILDSMDTLWIMDLRDEFEQAREWVRDELRFDGMGEISVFETVIRSVGGLLSAYDLSKDRMFLTKAVELADRISPAISQTTGRADYYLNTYTNRSHQAGSLAESGTYQLEFEYLSIATGDPSYSATAKLLYPYLRKQRNIQLNGLFANEIYAYERGHETSGLTVSFGANGDSFYEYLLKVWVLTGQSENSLPKSMYLAAMDGMEELLLGDSTDGHLFLNDFDMARYYKKPRMQHLACFIPGLLALGARRMEDEDPARSSRHMHIAKRLMQTCYEDFYEKQPSRLAPECLMLKTLDTCPDATYRLRPEVAESLYVLYTMTGDSMYQEWGWNIFQAIQRNCRAQYGYSQYRDVTKVVDWDTITSEMERDMWTVRMLDNKQETFFTAETLKYLYLLMDPENKHVSLDTHVFNTEAHPLSIPTK